MNIAVKRPVFLKIPVVSDSFVRLSISARNTKIETPSVARMNKIKGSNGIKADVPGKKYFSGLMTLMANNL